MADLTFISETLRARKGGTVWSVTVVVLALLGILDASKSAIAQAQQPTSIELALLYYKVSKLFLPWDDIASGFDDYRRAQDEFRRREVGARIKQGLEAEFARISVDQTFMFRTSVTLGEYQFEEKGFPTSFPPYMYYSIPSNMSGPPFAIVFLNARDVRLWPIDADAGRVVAQRLGRQRRVSAEIEYRVQRAREDQINYQVSRILDVKIERIRFVHQNGVLGLFEINR